MRRVAASISSLQARNSAHCRGLAVAFWKAPCLEVLGHYFCKTFVLHFASRGKVDWRPEVLVMQCLQVKIAREVVWERGITWQLAMDGALGSWDSLTNGYGVRSTQTWYVLGCHCYVMCCWRRNTFPAESSSQKRAQLQ